MLGLACATEVECGDGLDDDCDGKVDCEDDDCLEDAETCTPESACCKVCTSGEACGDSCIDSSSTCSTSGGCACDASEVCTGNELSSQESCEAENPPVEDTGVDPFADCE
jgi:hypothetical protein